MEWVITESLTLKSTTVYNEPNVESFSEPCAELNSSRLYYLLIEQHSISLS